MKSFRMETMKGRQPGGAPPRGGAPTITPHQMTPQELHEAQSPQDQFSPDNAEYQQGGGNSGNIVLITYRICINF